MIITAAQKRFLRGKAHHLKPVVMVGQHGLGASVQGEINGALLAHELIKVKISSGERDDKKKIIAEICSSSKAALIQTIGNMAIFYKRHPKKPTIILPKG